MRKLIHDFDFSVRCHKGSTNIVVDALIHIHEVNVLSFTELKTHLFYYLREKYLDETILQT